MSKDLITAFQILGNGMFALFVVMIIIALSVIILNHADNRNKDK